MITGKIKILRIITRLNIGGAALHIILLSIGRNKSDFECTILKGVEGKDEGSMTALAESRGLKLILVPEMTRELSLVNDIKAVYKIYKIIKREKPDIVDTHLSKAGFVGRLAAILAGGCKIVHTFHGHTLNGYWGKLKTRIFALLERFMAFHSHCLIACSERVREDLINLKIVPPHRIITIHNGLELGKFKSIEKFKGQFRRELGLNDRMILIGVLARLAPIKNHKLFLESASKMKDDQVRFLIIGDGELRQNLEDYAAALGIADKVIFTGFRNDLEKIYADLDISVISSLNEGLPFSVIESMAAGVPVVSTDVGGIRELIDDGIDGFVIPLGDADALADKWRLLISDENLRHEFAARAKEKAYPYFDYRRMVSDNEELYHCLVAGKSFHHLHLRGFRGSLSQERINS